jgi:small-conductance mechanosensitive channel
MILSRWNALVATIPFPAWWPAWATALTLPAAAFIAWAAISWTLPFLVPRDRRAGVRLLVQRTRLPIQLLVVTALIDIVLRQTIDIAEFTTLLDRAVPIVLVLASAILAYRAITTLFVALRRRFDLNTPDNLRARRATTQLIVLERVVGFTVVVIAIAAGLMTIPSVRQYGTSLLASAGVLGIVIGFAAQQTIANVLAGIQIAITQPLRIDDAVIIDGEWGRVEEITLTYVVVRIWDRRRLVVPIAYLLQKPFQNWTRSSASLIGSVYLHVDHTLDIDALRAEQTRVLAANPHWDGDVDVVQVVDTTEKTMLVRSLMSAADSPTTWDLRCEVREALIRWIRATYPDALPRERMRVQGTVTAERTHGSD